MVKFLLAFIFSIGLSISFSQSQSDKQIDSILMSRKEKPFNGVALIARKNKPHFLKFYGWADLEQKKAIQINDQFVVGSISKQFTAVLILQAVEKGKIELHVPIRNYLPELTQSWADSVTVHHLLTHTHGIVSLNERSEFPTGQKFLYSQLGYELLSKILEVVSGETFSNLAQELFRKCGMKNTCHPDQNQHKNLVKSYTENQEGKLDIEHNSLQNYAAAGSFISTANDLLLWNNKFYTGKLLKAKTMNLLLSKQPGAIRNHPLFGTTEYGYGITIDTKDNLLQLGQTGFAPGFISMSFYFPESKTSLILLENISYGNDELSKAFFFHTEVLRTLRKNL